MLLLVLLIILSFFGVFVEGRGNIYKWNLEIGYGQSGKPSVFQLLLSFQEDVQIGQYLIVDWPYSLDSHYSYNKSYPLLSLMEYDTLQNLCSQVPIEAERKSVESSNRFRYYFMVQRDVLLKGKKILAILAVSSVQNVPTQFYYFTPIRLAVGPSVNPGNLIFQENNAFAYVAISIQRADDAKKFDIFSISNSTLSANSFKSQYNNTDIKVIRYNATFMLNSTFFSEAKDISKYTGISIIISITQSTPSSYKFYSIYGCELSDPQKQQTLQVLTQNASCLISQSRTYAEFVLEGNLTEMAKGIQLAVQLEKQQISLEENNLLFVSVVSRRKIQPNFEITQKSDYLGENIFSILTRLNYRARVDNVSVWWNNQPGDFRIVNLFTSDVLINPIFNPISFQLTTNLDFVLNKLARNQSSFTVIFSTNTSYVVQSSIYTDFVPLEGTRVVCQVIDLNIKCSNIQLFQPDFAHTVKFRAAYDFDTSLDNILETNIFYNQDKTTSIYLCNSPGFKYETKKAFNSIDYGGWETSFLNSQVTSVSESADLESMFKKAYSSGNSEGFGIQSTKSGAQALVLFMKFPPCSTCTNDDLLNFRAIISTDTFQMTSSQFKATSGLSIAKQLDTNPITEESLPCYASNLCFPRTSTGLPTYDVTNQIQYNYKQFEPLRNNLIYNYKCGTYDSNLNDISKCDLFKGKYVFGGADNYDGVVFLRNVVQQNIFLSTPNLATDLIYDVIFHIEKQSSIDYSKSDVYFTVLHGYVVDNSVMPGTMNFQATFSNWMNQNSGKITPTFFQLQIKGFPTTGKAVALFFDNSIMLPFYEENAYTSLQHACRIITNTKTIDDTNLEPCAGYSVIDSSLKSANANYFQNQLLLTSNIIPGPSGAITILVPVRTSEFNVRPISLNIMIGTLSTIPGDSCQVPAIQNFKPEIAYSIGGVKSIGPDSITPSIVFPQILPNEVFFTSDVFDSVYERVYDPYFSSTGYNNYKVILFDHNKIKFSANGVSGQVDNNRFNLVESEGAAFILVSHGFDIINSSIQLNGVSGSEQYPDETKSCYQISYYPARNNIDLIAFASVQKQYVLYCDFDGGTPNYALITILDFEFNISQKSTPQVTLPPFWEVINPICLFSFAISEKFGRSIINSRYPYSSLDQRNIDPDKRFSYFTAQIFSDDGTTPFVFSFPMIWSQKCIIFINGIIDLYMNTKSYLSSRVSIILSPPMNFLQFDQTPSLQLPCYGYTVNTVSNKKTQFSCTITKDSTKIYFELVLEKQTDVNVEVKNIYLEFFWAHNTNTPPITGDQNFNVDLVKIPSDCATDDMVKPIFFLGPTVTVVVLLESVIYSNLNVNMQLILMEAQNYQTYGSMLIQFSFLTTPVDNSQIMFEPLYESLKLEPQWIMVNEPNTLNCRILDSNFALSKKWVTFQGLNIKSKIALNLRGQEFFLQCNHTQADISKFGLIPYLNWVSDSQYTFGSSLNMLTVNFIGIDNAPPLTSIMPTFIATSQFQPLTYSFPQNFYFSFKSPETSVPSQSTLTIYFTSIKLNFNNNFFRKTRNVNCQITMPEAYSKNLICEVVSQRKINIQFESQLPGNIFFTISISQIFAEIDSSVIVIESILSIMDTKYLSKQTINNIFYKGYAFSGLIDIKNVSLSDPRLGGYTDLNISYSCNSQLTYSANEYYNMLIQLNYFLSFSSYYYAVTVISDDSSDIIVDYAYYEGDGTFSLILKGNYLCNSTLSLKAIPSPQLSDYIQSQELSVQIAGKYTRLYDNYESGSLFLGLSKYETRIAKLVNDSWNGNVLVWKTLPFGQKNIDVNIIGVQTMISVLQLPIGYTTRKLFLMNQNRNTFESTLFFEIVGDSNQINNNLIINDHEMKLTKGRNFSIINISPTQTASQGIIYLQFKIQPNPIFESISSLKIILNKKPCELQAAQKYYRYYPGLPTIPIVIDFSNCVPTSDSELYYFTPKFATDNVGGTFKPAQFYLSKKIIQSTGSYQVSFTITVQSTSLQDFPENIYLNFTNTTSYLYTINPTRLIYYKPEKDLNFELVKQLSHVDYIGLNQCAIQFICNFDSVMYFFVNLKKQGAQTYSLSEIKAKTQNQNLNRYIENGDTEDYAFFGLAVCTPYKLGILSEIQIDISGLKPARQYRVIHLTETRNQSRIFQTQTVDETNLMSLKFNFTQDPSQLINSILYPQLICIVARCLQISQTRFQFMGDQNLKCSQQLNSYKRIMMQTFDDNILTNHSKHKILANQKTTTTYVTELLITPPNSDEDYDYSFDEIQNMLSMQSIIINIQDQISNSMNIQFSDTNSFINVSLISNTGFLKIIVQEVQYYSFTNVSLDIKNVGGAAKLLIGISYTPGLQFNSIASFRQSSLLLQYNEYLLQEFKELKISFKITPDIQFYIYYVLTNPNLEVFEILQNQGSLNVMTITTYQYDTILLQILIPVGAVFLMVIIYCLYRQWNRRKSMKVQSIDGQSQRGMVQEIKQNETTSIQQKSNEQIKKVQLNQQDLKIKAINVITVKDGIISQSPKGAISQTQQIQKLKDYNLQDVINQDDEVVFL